ncbi:MAG: gephyrin-like molybdotransferase Glp [Anaerovoracaceae bacterium]|jgi:molybdopterin molybdotransferase
MKLLKVDTIQEVQTKLHTYFSQMNKKTEKISLREASGRYLAEDIFADTDMPAFRRSVVDGYAVRGSDTFGVSDSIPVFLDVIGAVEMGKHSSLVIESGQAAYVPTGGMIPEGADAMVMVEHVDMLNETTIGVNKPAAPNSHIMNIGDDYYVGEPFYTKGHRISVKDIGLLAACGKESLYAYRKPKLSILSTGDELIEPGKKPGPCQIRDINAYAIAAFAEAAGAEVLSLSIISDEYDSYREAVCKVLDQSDLVIISGGSSAGNKDMTARVIDSMGEPGVITHGLAIKPGKPTIVGILNGDCETKAIIGLPGHPMSAIIVYDVVVNTFIKKYYFGNEETPQTLTANITENIHAGEGRETYQLVSLKRVEGNQKDGGTGWIAEPIRAKSGSISQLKRADGYVVTSADSEGVNAGQIVDVILINKGY